MKSYFYVFGFCSMYNLMVDAKIEYHTIPTVDTRNTTFNPKIATNSCTLIPDDGPCRSNIMMYYFDPSEMVCKRFLWGGCQGNGNRFKTKKQCLDKCLTKPRTGPYRPRWCSLSFDYGFCFGDLERWYYDRLWKVCKKTIYSGCGGNKNNFYSKEQCDSICTFGRGSLDDIHTTRDSSGMKKILIINPDSATKYKGRIQKTVATTIIKNNYNKETFNYNEKIYMNRTHTIIT